eukprot:snap_masked-scaffold_89-processed-gene-0.32-mRNA-1 protein AED:1.00 eAED:1.00 QI:0/-1/0/0/-1/1/1/0/390
MGSNKIPRSPNSPIQKIRTRAGRKNKTISFWQTVGPSFYIALFTTIIFTYVYVFREPKYKFLPQTLKNAPLCPSSSTSNKILLFGGTSMLGSYLVDEIQSEYPDHCLINYNRRPCEKCSVSIKGDIRDSTFIHQVFNSYKPKIVFVAIKPELEGSTYQEFIEVNFLALKEITDIAEASGVNKFIHVSSIAAASHYIPHHFADETFPTPNLTEYKAGYDISKRLIEDYILGKNSNKFQTLALRVSGIIGGSGDPFLHHRLPGFLVTFNNPIILDYGFAGNIAQALVLASKKLDYSNSGKFYYYTGDSFLENVTAKYLEEITGKYLLEIPVWALHTFLDIWDVIRPTYKVYSFVDLLNCAQVEQTFSSEKFIRTFGFKPRYTLKEALQNLYG